MGNKSIETIAQTGNWEFIPSTNDKIVGQSGDQVIRFTGVSGGIAQLKLEYKRPWETNKPAADEYTITVISAGKYTGSYSPGTIQCNQKQNLSSPVNEQTHNIASVGKFIKPDAHSAVKQLKQKNIASTLSTLPSSFSWQSLCTPIKDQQQCGSCWAFASNGIFEANISITDENTRDLSEQWLINCDATNEGCKGGWFNPGVGNLFEYPGCVYTSELPYADANCYGTTGTDSMCMGTCGTYTYHETISSFANVAGENTSGIPPDTAIKRAIYNYGPVWVSIAAGNNFQNYTGGIFTTTDGTITDHAVVLVGWYDDNTVQGGGYWILKNSWGSGWGESGYMRIAYDVSAVGSYAGYIVYKSGPPHNTGSCDTLFAPVAGTLCYEDSLTYYTIGANGYATGNNAYGFQEDAQRVNNTATGEISNVVVIEAGFDAPSAANTYVKLYGVDATSKAPSGLLGTSNPVALSSISESGAYVDYTFTPPVSISEAFYASVVLPTAAGDTLVVISSREDCNNGDSLSWEKWSDGSWHSFMSPNNFGPTFDPELYIFPILCTGSANVSQYCNAKNNIVIYPNPANDNITVENTSGINNEMISVYNIQGQLLLQQTMHNTKTRIDISALPSGVYVLKVRTESGVEVRKFVKG